MAKLLSVLCFVIGWICVPQAQTQPIAGCTTSTTVRTTNDDGTSAAATWVPQCTSAFEFCVRMDPDNAATDGVAELYLSGTSALVEPYYRIRLGWLADQSDVGDVTNLALCNGGDCTTVSKSELNGDVSETGRTCFAIYTETDSIHVRYYGSTNPFISLNGLDLNIFDPNNIRYVILGSHDGQTSTPGDLDADWDICTNNWQSLASGKAIESTLNDGDIAPDGTCADLSGGDETVTIDLGAEMHVVGVTLYNVETGATPDVQNTVIYVGSCPTYDDNVMCGTAVTMAEQDSGNPIYKACSTNSYGHYVYVHDPDGDLQLCEIVVHGKEVAEADKTKIAFDSATYSFMEETATHMETVELRRTGSATEFTCSCVDITNLGTGTATEGASADFQFNTGADLTVTFGKGEATKTTDLLSIIADCDYEGDETVILGLIPTTSTPGCPVEACIGSQSTTTITIADDDPKHSFSSSTASVREDVATGIVTLTIMRTGITDIPSEVAVSTDANCDGTPDAASTDSNDYTPLIGETVTFGTVAPGNTEQSIDIRIDNTDNGYDSAGNTDYADETFCVELVKVGNQGEIGVISRVTVTIENDDTVYELCDTDPEVTEGDSFIATICRRGKIDTSGCIDVFTDIALTNRAIPGEDYTKLDRTSVPFAGGDTTETVTISTIQDKAIETSLENILLKIAPCSQSTSDISPFVGVNSEELIEIIDDDTTYSVTSTINNIIEPAGSVTISFSRIASTEEGTIMVTVYGSTDENANIGTGSATEGLDFLLPNTLPHSVTFEVGSNTAELVIQLVNDKYLELDESFCVEIVGSDSTINEGRKKTTVTILNDDAYYAIQQVKRTVLESVNKFHVVVLKGPMVVNGVTIEPNLDYTTDILLKTNSDDSSTAIADEDFQPFRETLTFNGVTREAVKAWDVTVIDDQEIEGPEQFFVEISNANLHIDPDRDQTCITIEDDDGAISCSVNGDIRTSVDEDEDSVTVTCTRSGVSDSDGNDQSLNRPATYVLRAVSDSARQVEDFNPITRTLTFPANVATITETIDNLIIDDNVPEGDETFRLEIAEAGSGPDAASTTLYVTIVDDDAEGFGFENSEYTVGESCGELDVTIVRTGATGGLGTVLRVSASNGVGSNGATYPDDYATQEVTVQFLGNQVQQVVTFDINSDNSNEGAETFTIRLTKVSGSGDVNPGADVATVTIQDQTVTYSVQDAVITRDESSGTQPIVFVRSGDVCRDREGVIYVSTRDGTARSSQDYISFNNRRLTFPGNSNTVSVPLTILDDNNEELTETFTVEIQNNNNIIIGSGTTTVSIQDDDGRVYFRVSEYQANENQGSVTLTINRVGNSIAPTSVRIQTISNGGEAVAGSDYTSVTNRYIKFEASESSKSFSLTILDDNIAEADEPFCVEIIDTTDGTVSDPSIACVTIVDDDQPSGGLSTGAIIGIAAGIGGGVLLLLVIGGLLCLASLRPRRGVPVPRAPPVAYNGPASYPPDYGYRQDYRTPRTYYR
ncbi:uncharacterized protein [Amphiura filiformis]|uniref:uncharacterized protein n=1 Tax=Amphiura filiformis TaxID=82378 RepID=UPI003B2197EE